MENREKWHLLCATSKLLCEPFFDISYLHANVCHGRAILGFQWCAGPLHACEVPILCLCTSLAEGIYAVPCYLFAR